MKYSLFTILLGWAVTICYAQSSEFEESILPFLEKHCVRCHGGEKTKGEIDLTEIKSVALAKQHFDTWETAMFVIEDGEMPPKDEPQPSTEEREHFLSWYENTFMSDLESRPAAFKQRRLSGPEYRNTMRTLFGFDLEVNIVEAEQTVVEKSLILKLLPTDPPGASGYINDTHTAPLSTIIWNQYSYLADFALNELFSPKRAEALTALGGRPEMTETDAANLIRSFVPRALRRPVPDEELDLSIKRLQGKIGPALIEAVQTELKAVLMSPAFLYRGFLMPVNSEPGQQPVDQYELAERLSYFLWEDMPDAELLAAAATGKLNLESQIDRMLASPKARNLSNSFASQWLLLDQISDQRNDPTRLHALQSQPLDFLHYLFTENRPVMEMINSKVTFTNAYLASHYGEDRKQLSKFIKPKGIERMIMPNQKINLVSSANERGGILTMPGVLGMNRGPILRGTWMLRQILGEHLGEPPPDVPAIKSSPKGKDLTFRQLFEQHRADQSCAICHDKIDPLGFALQSYDDQGGIVGTNQSKKKKGTKTVSLKDIDTSGQLPSGESFANFAELKQLLLTTERENIVRNAVKQMLAYALCRKLEHFDQPTVDALTKEIIDNDGTWRDLIHGIANSLPFTETIIAKQ